MKMTEEHLPLVEQYAQEAMQLAHHTGDHKILAQSLTILGVAASAGELAGSGSAPW